jgi:sugar phosphate isomerase/epimerase
MTRTVSVSTALFDGYGMETAIEEIAAAGCRWVEPAYIKGYVDFDETAFSDAGAARLGGLIAGAGLSVTAISAHLDLGQAGAGAMLERRIGFASALGARFVITNAGQAADRRRILSVIKAVQPRCEAADIVLALENPGHGSGALIGNGGEGAALVREIGSPHVRLNYDVGNVFTYSHESMKPEDDIAPAVEAIAHLHLKDVASGADGWRFTAIGDGAIDYRAVWKVLPPGLPVAVELPLRLDRRGRADPVRRPDRVPLADIRAAMQRSLAFVAAL